MTSLKPYDKTLTARVSLVLGGITYCIKGERVQIAEESKKYTTFKRYYESKDSKGKKIFRSRKFKVTNDLMGLYFS